MIDKKFIESIDVNEWQVLTDTGYKDIKCIHKTIPYTVWEIQTESNKILKCADNHILFDENMSEIFVKDLIVNKTKIYTKDGLELVTKISVNKEEEKKEKQNMYDLELGEDSDHRYFTNDILSHNTTNLGIRTNLCMRLLPGLKIAAIVPRSEQLKTIADKYKEIENAYRFNYMTPNARSNLFFKEFPHPTGKMSQLRLWYILTNADKIRGNTYDWLDFDEYQDFDDSLETEILATQSRTKIPMLTYGGTSKSVDTALESKWMDSARGLWRLTCDKCKFDNYPTLKHGVMDMIKPQGLCCKKCGAILDVRKGQWDFEAPNLLDLGRWGFHVPQIIVPANTEDKAKWLRIYKASQDKNNFKGFCEEYLGEATEEGSKELSVSDLQNICVLGDAKTLQKEFFKEPYKKYIMTVGGVDWGGSDYNPAAKTKASYTVHTIIGITPSGHFDILESTKYAGMDWDTVSANIAKRHHDFKCYAIGSDFGVGAVYINNLRKHINPLRVITFKYSVPNSPLLSIPKNSNFLNLYSLNRTESISSLFMEIKKGRLRSPLWEQMKTVLMDCLNLVRIPVETAGGQNTFRYEKKGNKTDDFLHSLNFAVVLAKAIRGEPIFDDVQQRALFMNTITGGQHAGIIKRHGSSYSG